MATDIHGTAVVFGIDAMTLTFGGTSSANLPQSIRHGVTADNAKIKGANGNVDTIVFSGMMKTASWSGVPSGATLSAAITSANLQTALPGLKMVISGSSVTGINGNWIIASATVNRPVDGVVTVDFELENSYDTDLSASTA